MLSRCRNKNAAKFERYGGRGIKVCKRWEIGEDGASGFECFMLDMGNKPSIKHSLDRIDNDGDYEPGNCKWATSSEQANNRSSNHLITYMGETMSMMDMANKVGMSYFVLRNRISRGWPIDAAINAPNGTAFFDPKTARGPQLPQTKITEEIVRMIRSEYATKNFTMDQVAIRFGISKANVCLIVNRKSWKHVD
jgi:hypothetical protein